MNISELVKLNVLFPPVVSKTLVGLDNVDNVKQIPMFNSTPGLDSYSGVFFTCAITSNALGLGNLLVVNSSGNYVNAKADAVATVPCIALACSTGTGSGTILTNGYVRKTSWNWTPGGTLYVSAEIDGAITQTPPALVGQFVQAVGVAINATTIYFNPTMYVKAL